MADVAALAADVQSGDLPGARVNELAAQADFDEVRFVDAASPQNAASVDGLATEVPPGASFGGLHALERDLWAGGDTGRDLPSLEAQVAVTRDVVARQSLSPATTVATAVSQLDWVVDVALPGEEEVVSLHDAVDVAAGVTAAGQAFHAVRPLACTVDGAGCRTAASDLGSLTAEVADLGPAAQVTEGALAAQRLGLSQAADRAADALAALETSLLPFGTAGPEPYGAGA